MSKDSQGDSQSTESTLIVDSQETVVPEYSPPQVAPPKDRNIGLRRTDEDTIDPNRGQYGRLQPKQASQITRTGTEKLYDGKY